MNPITILSIKEFETEDVSTSFYANSIGNHVVRHEKAISKPHKHDFYLTVIFTKGFGIHEIDFNTYNVVPGSVFLLRPGQIHNWELSNDIDGYIFFHSENFYELEYIKRTMYSFPFFHSIQNPPILYLSIEQTKQVATIFNTIYKEFITDFLYKKEKLTSLLDLLFIELSRLYLDLSATETYKSSKYTNQLYNFEKLIERHYKEEKSPAVYANMLHITPKHLNRIVKTSLNKTSLDLIVDRVILEAKRMLVHSNDTLSNIANVLGYDDYAYFSRVFKRKTGNSPSVFKKDYIK